VAVTAYFRGPRRLISCALLLCALPLGSAAQPFDAEHSRFGFELRTRWGQRVEGDFPRYEGEVTELPDGRHQVRIRLATAEVEVEGPPRYTRFARGERFFDAPRHPWVEFQSDPYSPALLQGGGRLRGTLSMHGVSRIETFVLAPSTCARPARDCDVLAYGSVSRTDYGLDGWRFVILDRVQFNLRVRLHQDASS